jgi:hypothetical protein
MSTLKRYEFICKGKRSHFLDATSEDAARSFFAENRFTSSMEIIDVIEVPMPTPITSGINMKLEGFERTNTEIKPTSQEIAALAASSEKIGY